MRLLRRFVPRNDYIVYRIPYNVYRKINILYKYRGASCKIQVEKQEN
jgi:hypothetical protein